MADFFGTGPQTTTNTTNLGFATPYIDRLMYGGEGIAQQAYTPYGGQRVAQVSPLQQQAYQQAQGMGTPGQFQQASTMYQQAGQAGKGLASFMPGQFSYQAFGAPQAAQYMSPYQQGVIDITRREADTAFQKQQNQLRMGAAQRGAFGGGRSTLMEMEAQRGQNQLQSDLQKKGLQEAFLNAQQQFNADQQRLATSEQAREQARQQAANLMLQGNQQSLAAAQGLGSLGTQQAESERQRLNQLAQFGTQMRDIQQQGLDVDYSNFLEQRDYGKKQLEFLKNLYSGLPTASQSQATAPGAALINQLLSTGLGGAAIYNILMGKKP